MKVTEHTYLTIEIEAEDTVVQLYAELFKLPSTASVIAYEGYIEIHPAD